MVDPWEGIDTDTVEAAEALHAPLIEYWVSVGGVVYPAACSDDARMDALRASGSNVWRTIDGRRE